MVIIVCNQTHPYRYQDFRQWTLCFIASGIPTKKPPLIVIRVNFACPLNRKDYPVLAGFAPLLNPTKQGQLLYSEFRTNEPYCRNLHRYSYSGNSGFTYRFDATFAGGCCCFDRSRESGITSDRTLGELL